MQINNVVKIQTIQHQQNFKGGSVNSSSFSSFPNYQSIPLDTSKAYASPQITEGYKEIETFDVPYVGKGKLYELANGHKVIIVPKASKTYISTIVNAGYSDEPAEKKEVAHLTEHLLANYWHNADETSEIKKVLKETGTSGNANTVDGFTSYHLSAYIQNNADLEKLIKIQLGVLTNNNYDNEKIEKEKNIIISEGEENKYFIKPEIIAQDESIKNLFNLDSKDALVAEHNIQKIENLKKEDLDRFYIDFYRPDNMTTIIIGNVNDNSIKTISKFLNKMPKPSSKMVRDNISVIDENKYIKQFTRKDIASLDKKNIRGGFVNLSFIGPKITNVEDTENVMIINKIIKNRLEQQNLELNVDINVISGEKDFPQIISIDGDDFEGKMENNIKIIVKPPIFGPKLKLVFDDFLAA